MENPSDETPARWERLPSWLLTQTANHAHRLVTEGFSAAGARGYHYRLLATLDEYGPSSQADLGRRAGIDRSDVVAALNELAAKNLIARSPDPSDRRRNIVTLTPDGSRHLDELDQVVSGIQDDLLAPLSPDERRRLTDLLTRLADHHAKSQRP